MLFLLIFPFLCILLFTETNCCCHIPCLFTSFKVFPALCGKEKYFLSRLIRLSTDARVINLLWKSDWAEKRFETVIQQTERGKNCKFESFSRFTSVCSGWDGKWCWSVKATAQSCSELGVPAWNSRVSNETMHPLCSWAAFGNSRAEEKSKWVLWEVLAGKLCRALCFLLHVLLRNQWNLAILDDSVWFQLGSVIIFAVSRFCHSPTPPVLPLPKITTQNPSEPSPAWRQEQNPRWAQGEALGWARSWFWTSGALLEPKARWAQVSLGLQGSGGLSEAPAHREPMFIQNIYHLVFLSPCLFQEHCCIPTGISLWCFFSL